jgi:hypothetical protein
MENLMFISTGRFAMSFSDVVHEFSNSLACTDAFEDLKHECLQLSKTDPENAAACFLTFGFARSYVLLYDEEAVPTELAIQEFRESR